jgi:LppP/LprE lipoprotein
MSRLISTAFAGAVLLTALVQAQIASAQQAIWLDQPLAAWNRPSDQVPEAPAPLGVSSPQCSKNERAPVTDGPAPRAPSLDASAPVTGNEEPQVEAAGWRLEAYWPTQRKGDLAVLLATSAYDGMCRPWRFNGFMFYRGRFAGTLSPVNMNSREDGVLAQDLSLPNDGELDAQFIRYAPTDPLCCPSRGRTVVRFGRHGSTAAPVMVPEKASPLSPGQRSGGWLGLQLPQILALAVVSALVIGASGGLLLRRGLARRRAS